MSYLLTIQKNSSCNQFLLTNDSTAGETVFYTLKKLTDSNVLSLCEQSDFTYQNSEAKVLTFPLEDFDVSVPIGTQQSILAGETVTIIYTQDNLYLISNFNVNISSNPNLSYLLADCEIQDCNRKIDNEILCKSKTCSIQKFVADRTRWIKFERLKTNLYNIFGKYEQVQTLNTSIAITTDELLTINELIDSLINLCGCCNGQTYDNDLKNSTGLEDNCGYWRGNHNHDNYHNDWYHNYNNEISDCGCK